jgi:hypothetical protein
MHDGWWLGDGGLKRSGFYVRVMNRPPTVVLDNGASTLKAGTVGSTEEAPR